ncbi:hypothetical protein POM88_044699 [Heracleum sosnowskyi]|uniref:Transposase-associated domain-containing protein n=1 Tax=Heracleum sosnowskyi TaxID=360622 RepID=A0AAD8M352_9APIA|nr:hypothetical protein POM88_044699 [Heracleum sosnowskyi]
MDDDYTSWIGFPKSSKEYVKGIEAFMKNAFPVNRKGEEMKCPCKVCVNRNWHLYKVLFYHLICNGPSPLHLKWIFEVSHTKVEGSNAFMDCETRIGFEENLEGMGFKENLGGMGLEDNLDGEHLEIRAAIFDLTKKEKDIFCSVLKNAKLPYGCASNISRYVHTKQRKVVGFLGGDEATKKTMYCPSQVEYHIGTKRNKAGIIFNLNDVDWNASHRYVLFNSGNKEVERLIKEHQDLVDKTQVAETSWCRDDIPTTRVPIPDK